MIIAAAVVVMLVSFGWIGVDYARIRRARRRREEVLHVVGRREWWGRR